MKNVIATAAAVLFGLAATTASADEHHRSQSNHCATTCHCEVTYSRVFVGYDRKHKPVYRYVQNPVVCRESGHRKADSRAYHRDDRNRRQVAASRSNRGR